MSVQILRFRTSPENSDAVRGEIAALFAAVHAAAPGALRYIALQETALQETARQETGEPVFTLILELLDGAGNPLPSIPAALSFRSRLPRWTDDDLTPRPCTVLGRYTAR